ncbi:hypothetical protein [Nonomuraea aurantiaca]|jgi:hypothetical protein|nr:hypothetical protein [Nonomuraea aurantiaca]MCA2224020.1 hypothetical protein [Nonomuraea aurantiaca]
MEIGLLVGLFDFAPTAIAMILRGLLWGAVAEELLASINRSPRPTTT